MNLSLTAKGRIFIAVAVVTVTLVNTVLFISGQQKSIKREVIARGAALSEALSRSVSDGLAMENLNLIKSVEEVVHSRDVLLTQVFSVLWLGIAAVPVERLNDLPDPGAVDYFNKFQQASDYYVVSRDSWIDVYHPVFYDPRDVRVKKILVGFVRIRISTEPVKQAIRGTVRSALVLSAVLTFFSLVILNLLMKKYLLRPVLDLHHAISRHKEGEFPLSVPVHGRDEIGELSAEFNAMSVALREREAKLAEEKERLAVTLRSIGDAVIVTDVAGTITLMNRVAEHCTGWTAEEAAAGKRLEEVFRIISEKTGEPCEHPVEKVVTTGLTSGLAKHTALIKKDGTRIVIEDSAAPIRDKTSKIVGVVLVFRDVTEKRRIEEELIKSEKLQSVGILAGGLAHDFNNLLTSIVGNISIAKMYIDKGNKAQARLIEAEAASRRATDLTYQLLTFSKGGTPIRKTVLIGDIIRETAGFALSGTNVAPEFVLAADCWHMDADAGQLSQVFNNLIINAVQAMPNGGMVRCAAANKLLRENEVPPLPAGAYVHVMVEDTGTGIPADHLHRVFDPYFTTKQKGSGLGLASAYSIIKRHDGHITVESKPGQGARFHLYLPASLNTPASIPACGIPAIDGHGKVLVMDDEKIVRDVAGEMLRELGFEVDFAQNGAEAVERYRNVFAAGERYSIVIMDLTVPAGMGGAEAIRRLLQLDPEVIAIVSSGYSNDPVIARYKEYGFRGAIVKPYSIEGFSKVLSDVTNYS